MSSKSLFVAGVIFMALVTMFSVPARAQTEYANGVIAFERYNFFDGTYDPISPKIACKPDNSMCVALIYERGGYAGYTAGLKLFHSDGSNAWINGEHFQHLTYSCGGLIGWWDSFFGGCSAVAVPSAFDFSDYNGMDDEYTLGGEYPLPYDIVYSGSGNVFYILFNKGFNSYPSQQVTTYVYRYNGDLTAPTLVGSRGNTGFVGIVNSTTFLAETIRGYPDGGYYNYNLDWNECSITGLACDTYYRTVNIVYHAMSSLSCQRMEQFKGFGFKDTARQHYTRSVVKLALDAGCVNPPSTFTTLDDNFDYAGSFSGFDYFDGSYAYFSVGSNSTYRVPTDGASYGSATIVHAWSGENINHSVTNIGERNQVFLWDRGILATQGIYAYNERVYSFKNIIEGLNVDSGTTESVSFSTQLLCAAQNYTTSVNGINQIFTTPCATGNAVSLLASTGWSPISSLITPVNSLSSTSYTFIRSPANGLGWVKDYNFTLRFVNSFTGSPVSDATITVGTQVRTTTANGEAVFTLAPYESASITAVQVSNNYYLYLNGTPKTYDFQFAKAGYTTRIGTFVLTTALVPDSVTDFDVSDTFQVDPVLARLIVNVYTNDGVQYTGDSVVVRVGGAQNGTYVDEDGIFVEREYVTTFPSTFALLDSRASWNITLNLTQGTYFATTLITASNATSVYRYDFTLPNASTNQQCLSDVACSDSFCKGSTWYSNGHCVTGVCSYSMQACLLCDAVAGCFQDTTTTPCHFDSECYGSNRCIDSKFLDDYKCSGSGTCIRNTVECSGMCTDDVCVGVAAAVSCDQSTVVGMLTCMQSGVMGFVGFTYNPMMAIGIAMFLVILIIAILGLSFRAVASVIR
jgi:hypothetical protein